MNFYKQTLNKQLMASFCLILFCSLFLGGCALIKMGGVKAPPRPFKRTGRQTKKTSGLKAPSPRALLKKARGFALKQRYKKALKILAGLPPLPSGSDSFLREVYSLKESLFVNTRKPPLAFLKLSIHFLNRTSKNRRFYEQKAWAVLFSLPEKTVLSLAGEPFTAPVQDAVLFRAAQILFFRDDFKRAYKLFKKAMRFSRRGILEEKALKYIQAIESRKKVHPKKFGAVLALSGPSAGAGRRSLKGLQLGLGFYTKQASSFQLAVIDSQGLADKARQAVKTLVMKHHVIAVVGGILSKTASAMAEEAQNFGLPAVLLSQKTGLTKHGEYIFQNGLGAHLIVDKITDFLMRHLSFKKLAVLYPNDSYGVDYANHFWAAVEQKGGVVTAAQVYKPGETDFNGPVQRLIGSYYKEDREQEYKDRLKAWYRKKNSGLRRGGVPGNLLSPAIDFSALFVPDSSKVLAMAASHLSYHEAGELPLAGTTLWSRTKKIRTRYKGRIFFVSAEPPDHMEPRFKKSEFYKNFQNIFSKKPGLFETQAYESALILRSAAALGARSRNQLKKNLTRLKYFSGPIGRIHINEKREFERPLFLFQVKDGVVSYVSGRSSEI